MVAVKSSHESITIEIKLKGNEMFEENFRVYPFRVNPLNFTIIAPVDLDIKPNSVLNFVVSRQGLPFYRLSSVFTPLQEGTMIVPVYIGLEKHQASSEGNNVINLEIYNKSENTVYISKGDMLINGVISSVSSVCFECFLSPN